MILTLVDNMTMDNDLFRKYPKMALQGKDLENVLDAEWKKAFVSFVCASLVGVELSKKSLTLGEQISDELNDIMAKEVPTTWNPKYEPEIKIIFRIKNILASGHKVIVPFVKETDAILIASKKRINDELAKGKLTLPKDANFIMSETLYAYYVPAKATLYSSQEENLTLVNGIDQTIPKVFGNSVDFKAMEKVALSGVNTENDVREIFAKVVQSTGLDLKV